LSDVDLHFKFEEVWTKTAVAIESDRYFGWTDKHSSDFISVQCHELYWTDKTTLMSYSYSHSCSDYYKFAPHTLATFIQLR